MKSAVVALHHVQLGEVLAPVQLVGEIMDDGQMILVRQSVVVESPVVTTRSPAPISLGYHVQRAGLGRVKATNDVIYLPPPV